MRIECPNCGFSGRVPGYVADAPHHARCPKCRFGFDIGDLVARTPETVESSSNDSSYEIKALGGVWEDEEESAPRLAPRRELDPPSPPAAGEFTAIWRVALLDWRVRLVEGWAVVLLVWAGLIGSRVAYAALRRGDELVFSQALFWPIAAVVLLVVAAAGLLLTLECGQRSVNGPGPVLSALASTKRKRLAKAKSGSD